MLSKSAGLMAFKPRNGALMSRRQFGLALPTCVLALACVAVSGPAVARTRYDGEWSVLILTRSGGCPPAIHYNVEIADGRVVNAGGGAADVQGRVTPAGAVRVSVRAGNAWVAGSGRLGPAHGGGVWRGQGTSGFCQGSWVAERRGYAAQMRSGAPIYSYAPR